MDTDRAPDSGGREAILPESADLLWLVPDDKRWLRPGRGVPTLGAPTEIGGDGAGWLLTALLEAAAYGHAKLVVDVTGTQYADPAGLRLLVRAHDRAQGEGRANGLAIPGVIIRRAPGIFWLSEFRKL